MHVAYQAKYKCGLWVRIVVFIHQVEGAAGDNSVGEYQGQCSFESPLGVRFLVPELPRPMRRRLRTEPTVSIRLNRLRLNLIGRWHKGMRLTFVGMRLGPWKYFVWTRSLGSPHSVNETICIQLRLLRTYPGYEIAN